VDLLLDLLFDDFKCEPNNLFYFSTHSHMKKFLSISLLLSILFLYGCSTSNKLSADQLFEKKQECAKYKESLQGEIDKMGSSYSETINEIFYSVPKNSCFALTYRVRENHDSYVITDLLTNEITTYSEEMYYKKVKELKWE